MNTLPIPWLFPQPGANGHHARESMTEDRAAFWRINGHRTRLLVWTQDEWNRLESPPPDAQYHPTGVWCALRLD